MSNDSSTGGPLLTSSTVTEDDALDDFFQALVVGLTGLPGNVVFPRFQAEPPNLPDFGTNWAAVGVMSHQPDTFAYVQHQDSADAHTDEVSSVMLHETLDVLCSFYGPSSGANSMGLYRGLLVAQNREPLQIAGMGLHHVQGPVRAPELIKDRWTNRYDMHVFIRREVDAQYAVLSLLSATAMLNAAASSGIVAVNVNAAIPQQ